MSRKHTHTPQISPAYTGRLSMAPVPALRMPDECMDPDAAYRFIHDELMLDGSSRLNLATFVSTWMDPQAEKLMAETFDKNMIDKDEYPATAAIEERCVCMVADLFHAEDLRDDDPSSAIGVSTVGSSEAVMLAGLALKWRWREKVGKNWMGRTPNLVMGSNVQVVWEKFCRYFDVEPRYLPMAEGRYVITPEQVLENIDEDTIGVVGILGTTFTGELEPIAEICAALDKLAAGGGLDIPVHVDAASGGGEAAVLPGIGRKLVHRHAQPKGRIRLQEDIGSAERDAVEVRRKQRVEQCHSVFDLVLRSGHRRRRAIFVVRHAVPRNTNPGVDQLFNGSERGRPVLRRPRALVPGHRLLESSGF